MIGVSGVIVTIRKHKQEHVSTMKKERQMWEHKKELGPVMVVIASALKM